MANDNSNAIIATVVKIIDEYTVVINRGSDSGLKIGDRFLIYCIDDEEIFDPETKESLGRLEIVRGRGSVSHLQEKLATIKSSMTSGKGRTIKRTPNFLSSNIFSSEIIEEPGTEILPFDRPKLNDKAKRL